VEGSNLLNIVPLIKIVKRVHVMRQNHNTYHITYGLAYVMFKRKWHLSKVAAKWRGSQSPGGSHQTSSSRLVVQGQERRP